MTVAFLHLEKVFIDQVGMLRCFRFGAFVRRNNFFNDVYKEAIVAQSIGVRGGPRMDAIAPPPLKPTKVTLFAMIMYNSENNIRE